MENNKPEEITEEQKRDALNKFTEFTVQHILTFFKIMGLKNHIDCLLYNEPTDERFIFRFYKVDTGYTPAADKYASDVMLLESEIKSLQSKLKVSEHLKELADDAYLNLKKDNEELKSHIKQLVTDQDILAKELKDALYDVDEFAIAFLEWVDNSPYISDEVSGFWSTFTKGVPKITIKELVEIYRQSLK